MTKKFIMLTGFVDFKNITTFHQYTINLMHPTTVFHYFDKDLKRRYM